MSSSLLTGVSGLRINQEMLDVIGNNLANSNTTGYKSQSVRFSDVVYQTLSQATGSTPTTGGTDPQQIGLGAQVANISPDLTQGSLASTGRDLDMALQGNGYFVVKQGTATEYTRAGAFGVDSNNFLVDPATGARVQRFDTVGEGSATSPAFQVPGNNDINIPVGTSIPGTMTSSVTVQGNLSANAVGPQAQVLTSAQPYLAGGAPVVAGTLINDLDDNQLDYGSPDQLQLQGFDAANNPINVTIPVDTSTTMGDLVNAINTNFAGATASIDATGNLVVQANATGPTSLSVNISDVAGNAGTTVWGTHTATATTTGKDGDTVKTGIQVFDSQGTAHNLDMVFQKQANNTWNMTAAINPSEGTITDNVVSNITFNQNGSFQQVSGTGLGNNSITVLFNGLTTPQNISFNLGNTNGFNGITQVGGDSSAVATQQDGFSAGYLTTLDIDQNGVINGIFTNGKTLPIAQLAIASFANPSALDRVGNNYLTVSTESGTPMVGAGNTAGRGSVQQKTLESSNVDVSLEFTQLIIAQRGFEVNAKVITASDQMLQDLTNIIR